MSRHDDAVTVELAGATGAELVLAVTAGGRVRTLRLPPTGELTIGRSRQCDVQIEDAGVSGKHATLRVAPLAIKDLDSRNGLWLRGRRLEPGVFVELSTRDVVEIGGGFLTVRPARGPARPRRI